MQLGKRAQPYINPSRRRRRSQDNTGRTRRAGTEKRGQTQTRQTVGQMFDDKIHELIHEIYLSKFESMKCCPGMWMDI